MASTTASATAPSRTWAPSPRRPSPAAAERPIGADGDTGHVQNVRFAGGTRPSADSFLVMTALSWRNPKAELTEVAGRYANEHAWSTSPAGQTRGQEEGRHARAPYRD